ncbi:hypothetical protein GCM10022215_14830 [Nocardioides fonticola]|uniref:Uncharacterized protein n=1 Tax=Nocardioides fonticola TaxID=450363 RepID=A0ABP7XHD7_9ACTN
MIEVDIGLVRKGWNPQTGHLEFLIDADFGDHPPSRDRITQIAEETSHTVDQNVVGVCANQWLLTPQGWSGILTPVHTMDALLEWFEVFARAFPYVQGRVTAPPRREPRALPTRLHNAATPAAHVAYTTGDLRLIPRGKRGPLWLVDATLTRFIADRAITWAYQRGCRQYVNRYDMDWWIEVEDLDYASAIAESIHRYSRVQLLARTTDPIAERSAHLSPHGKVTFYTHDDRLDWRAKLDLIRQTLLWSPPNTDVAFIAAAVWPSFWSPERQVTRWPYIRESELRYNRPLLSSFTPDAYGIQILTDAHLARAHDLTGWLTTPLAGGRYLVEHPDLAAWYAQPEPHPDVLAKARADFGDMILTTDHIATHNPWTDPT